MIELLGFVVFVAIIEGIDLILNIIFVKSEEGENRNAILPYISKAKKAKHFSKDGTLIQEEDQEQNS